MMRKRIVSATACLVIASLVLGGCGGKTEEVQEDTALSVEVKQAKKKELVIKETYVGTASAQEEVTVYPTASGEVMQVNVKLGDTVTEGQQLFKLDDENARLGLKSAQAAHASAAASANAQLGGQESLNEQKEQQQIDSYERTATEAGENLERGERKVDEAAEDRDRARKDYDESVDKYHKAKRYYDDLKSICDDDDEFSGASSLAEAVQIASGILASPTVTTTDPVTGIVTVTEVEGVSTAEDIMDLADSVSGEDDIGASDVSSSGVNALKTAMESRQTALINQRRAVSNAKDSLEDYKRTERSADEAVDNAVANQQLQDGQVLEDTRRSLQANVANSAVGVEQAQYALDQYTSKSPINGVVDEVNIDPHDTVGPSTAAMVISNKDSMKIDFSVTETVRDNLSIGQKVKVIKDGEKYKGAITEIGEMLDGATGMFQIQAVVNGGTGLMSGSTVTVKVDSYRDDSGIVVPYDAVYYSNGAPYLYVIEDGKAVRRDVQTGMFDEKHIVIVSGLEVGEQVITSWAADLRDGAKVQVAGTEEGSSGENTGSSSEETEKEGQSGEDTTDESDSTTEKAGD